MANEYDALCAALDVIGSDDKTLSDDHLETLQRMIESYRPYEGDKAEQYKQREHVTGLFCGNCDLQWDGPYSPMELTQYTGMTFRLCVCPRCANNKRIMIVGSRSPSRVPERQS